MRPMKSFLFRQSGSSVVNTSCLALLLIPFSFLCSFDTVQHSRRALASQARHQLDAPSLEPARAVRGAADAARVVASRCRATELHFDQLFALFEVDMAHFICNSHPVQARLWPWQSFLDIKPVEGRWLRVEWPDLDAWTRRSKGAE